MANRWNIPDWLENEIRARDRGCVYCRAPFASNNSVIKSAPSWEHIINDARITTAENIALCCRGCNSSKGQKSLSVWLKSEYCEKRGINAATVALVVKSAITNGA